MTALEELKARLKPGVKVRSAYSGNIFEFTKESQLRCDSDGEYFSEANKENKAYTGNYCYFYYRGKLGEIIFEPKTEVNFDVFN